MHSQNKVYAIVIGLIIGLGVSACNAPQAIPDVLQESSQGWDPCASMPDMGLDLQAAASAPSLVGSGDSATLGMLGQQGAQRSPINSNRRVRSVTPLCRQHSSRSSSRPNNSPIRAIRLAHAHCSNHCSKWDPCPMGAIS